MQSALLYVAIKHNGNWNKIYHALEEHTKIPRQNLTKLENKIKCDYITIINKNYPIHLKRIYKPPFVVFGVGDFSNFDQPLITIVGRIEKFNTPFLDALQELGYGFIYQVNENTYKSAKRMAKSNYRVVFVVNAGINHDWHDLYGSNTLVISEYYNKPNEEYNDQNLNRITLGSENKILFIDYDEYEQYQDELALCHFERNHLYKIIYKYDQAIVNQWTKHHAELIWNIGQFKAIFSGV